MLLCGYGFTTRAKIHRSRLVVRAATASFLRKDRKRNSSESRNRCSFLVQVRFPVRSSYSGNCTLGSPDGGSFFFRYRLRDDPLASPADAAELVAGFCVWPNFDAGIDAAAGSTLELVSPSPLGLRAAAAGTVAVGMANTGPRLRCKASTLGMDGSISCSMVRIVS